MDEIGIKTLTSGISMGSRIVQTIAVKYPEKVKSLILNVTESSFSDPVKPITDASLENPDLREKCSWNLK